MKMDEQDVDRVFAAAPFRHQVGGHGPVVRLDSQDGQWIAKPLQEKEFQFYQNAPIALQPFIAGFHGLARVRFSPDAINKAVTVPSRVTNGAGAAVNHHGEQFLDAFAPLDITGKSDGDHNDMNPWSERMYQKQLKQLGPSRCGANEGVEQCILLDNLTSNLKNPCVLDIKIGTRLHDDNADEAKRLRCVAKASTTTTSLLGIRLCGMQVYSAITGKYLCQDKYIGRKLTTDTIAAALQRFFELSTGNHPRQCRRSRSIVERLLEKIGILIEVLRDLKGMRFYSSSLLIFYDGDVSKEDPTVDIKMIDFAHTSHYTSGPDSLIPDEGYLFGLQNLRNLLSSLIVGSVSSQQHTPTTGVPRHALTVDVI